VHTQATCHALVEGSNGDIRLILGQLQMVRLRSSALSYDDVKGRLGTSKDSDISPFEWVARGRGGGRVEGERGRRG
jgi:replication factor C subunit 1